MSTKTAKRLESVESNVWVEFIQLALEYKPINLGQGFPDFAAPEHICKALSTAVLNDDNVLINQYTRDMGHPRLVEALSRVYSKQINRRIDAYNEILITSGAYEALFCTFMAFVDPGDEVIIIEPYFDCYEPMTRMAGGVPVFIALRPKPSADRPASSAEWLLDYEELESKFSSKTKFIAINTPNNPLGKVLNFRYDRNFGAELPQNCHIFLLYSCCSLIIDYFAAYAAVMLDVCHIEIIVYVVLNT